MNNCRTCDKEIHETVLQSAHREWIEDRECEQQIRDERFVERFLAGQLRHWRSGVSTTSIRCFSIRWWWAELATLQLERNLAVKHAYNAKGI
jgi:hypothetical protein